MNQVLLDMSQNMVKLSIPGLCLFPTNRVVERTPMHAILCHIFSLPSCLGSKSSVHRSRLSRGSKSALSIPKPDTTQEYELMHKQPLQVSPSPTDTTERSALLNKQSSPTKPANPCILQQKTDSETTQTEQSDNCINPTEEDSLLSGACGDSPVETATCNEGNRTERLPSQRCAVEENLSVERQPQETAVEYEYMDIRTESLPEHQQNPTGESVGTLNVRTSSTDVTASREGVYQNISEVPGLTTTQSGRRKAREDSQSNTRHGEYVDMEASGQPCCEGDQPEYQNFPGKGRQVVGEESQKNSLRSCMKVYNGIEEQSTSFDNPDYWHSRLFLKQDAVCT